MTCHQGDMTGICVGFLRDNTRSDNGVRESQSLPVEREERDINQGIEPVLSRLIVTPRRLVVNQLRNEEFIHLPSLSPPLLGHLLLTSKDYIFGGPRFEETRNRCLDVNSRLHTRHAEIT